LSPSSLLNFSSSSLLWPFCHLHSLLERHW
jgi:hypothetical protein